MVAIDLRLDEDQILASGINGYVACAPMGTVGPVWATDDLDPAFVSFGLLKDNGIVTALKKDQDEKKAWNVRGVVKRIAKDAGYTFKFTSLQTTALAMKLRYGNAPANIATHAGNTSTKILAKSDVTPYAWVIDVPMDDGTVERTFVERGIVTDVDDITYSEVDANEFGFTVAAVAAPGNDHLGLILSNAPGLVPVP